MNKSAKYRILSHVYLPLVIVVCLLVLAFYIPLIRTYLLVASNIFFYGKSDAKLFGFLIYLTTILLGTSLKISRNTKTQPFSMHGISKIYFLIALLSVLSLCSYFYYIIKFDLDPRTFPTFIFNGGFEGFSQLIHIHTLKSAFTWPLTLFRITDLSGYGDGIVFFNYMPFFYIFTSTILLILVIAIVRQSWRFVESPTFRFYDIFLYSLLSFGVIKALIDGGPLNNEFIFSLLFFSRIINFYTKQKIPPLFVRETTMVLLLMTILYFCYYRFYLGIFDLGRIYHLINPIWSTFCILLFLTLMGFRKKMDLYLLLLLLVGLGFQYDSPTLKEIGYNSFKIPKNSKVVIVSKEMLPYPRLYKGPAINSYLTTASEETTSMDYINKNNLRFQYYPVMVDGFNCKLNSTDIYWLDILVVEGNPDLGVKVGGLSDHTGYSKLECESKNNCYLQLHIKGCHPTFQHIAAQELLKRGVVRAIILKKENPVSITDGFGLTIH